MDADDITGAAWGGMGGLVRWFRERAAGHSWWEIAASAVGSVAMGIGVGYSVHAVVRWQFPDVPSTVLGACSFVAGVSSGIILQFAVGAVSELAGRFRAAAVDRIAPPTTGRTADGPAPSAGPDASP
jgi:cation transporter-like permease